MLGSLETGKYGLDPLRPKLLLSWRRQVRGIAGLPVQVQGLGFGVLGLRSLGVWGVWGLGVWGFRVLGLGFRVARLRGLGV